MKLIKYLLVLLLANANANANAQLSLTPDVVFAKSLPGEINWVGHDPQAIYADHTNFVNANIGTYIYANSYGRNTVTGTIDDQCVDFGSLCFWSDPNRIDYSFNCPTINGTWDPYVTVHETLHCFDIGEGAAKSGENGTVDWYGDNYYPLGSQSNNGGHLPAFYKEHAGFLGAPESGYYYTVFQAKQSGQCLITDIGSQTPGTKAIKVLYQQYILYRSDGAVYQDRRDYFYIEMRPLVSFYSGSTTTTKGHGKKNTTGYYYTAPGVQFRTGRPNYVGQGIGFHAQGYLRLDIGYRGALRLGQSYSFVQDIQRQVTYDGIITHEYHNVTVTVSALDSLGATLSVTIM